MGRARRYRLSGLALLVAAAMAGTSGCSRDQGAPQALADGSAARPPRIELEGVGEPVVLSRALIRKVRAVKKGSQIASCLESGWSEPSGGVAVLRIGVFGESVTFGSSSDEGLRSCDSTSSTYPPAQSWCGHAYGRLTRGQLRDPRLGLGGCATEDGRPVAFAWIEPGPGARYVVVRHAGFSEVHESAADLAVRVASTSGVDATRLRAVFDVSEHSADGRRLRAYELEATVSG